MFLKHIAPVFSFILPASQCVTLVQFLFISYVVQPLLISYVGFIVVIYNPLAQKVGQQRLKYDVSAKVALVTICRRNVHRDWEYFIGDGMFFILALPTLYWLIRICNVGSSRMRLSWKAGTLNQLRRCSLSCWPCRTYVIKHSDSELMHKTWALIQHG